MSDSDLVQEDSAQQVAPEQLPADAPKPKSKPAKRKSSMFDDPVVRAMAWGAGVVVILVLASLVGMVFFGMLGDRAPRTAVERRMYELENLLASGNDKDPGIWASYINSLVVSRKYSQAETAIKKAYSKVDQKVGADITLAEARLLLAKKDYDGAFAKAEEAQKIIQKHYDAEVKSDVRPNVSLAFGINKNFAEASLVKAEVLVQRGDTAGAEKQYTAFLKINGQASDVFILRGDARAKLGNTKGAKSDYDNALKYDPTNQAALDGLKQIGEGK